MQNSLITAVGQIHISCTDFSRAMAFYRDVLELPLLFAVEAQRMAFFDCGGTRLYLGVPSKPEYAANSFLYYRVDDIHHAYETLVSRGVEFKSAPNKVHADQHSELWMAGFTDSEGNLAQLMSEHQIAN